MMRAFSLAEACAWTGAPAEEGFYAIEFKGVSTDTRSLKPGELFVALRGDNFDGHRFLATAQQAGAVAAVVDTPDASCALPQLVVADTVEALARLAEGNRKQSAVQLVAVTGSSGKTTVREMTAAILAQLGKTLATEGNLNNHIGVPLTVFRLAPDHEYAVTELGASGVGEIAHTVAIVHPRVVILTNAGEAHLEGFGSYENIVRTKGEIIDGVTDGGLVVLNRDDPAYPVWQKRAGARRVASVSRLGQAGADYRVVAADVAGQGQRLQVAGPDNWACELTLKLLGEHNQLNALLAIAAARELGADDRAIQAGLAALEPVRGRLQALALSDRLTVIDDSYNANPSSMKAALAVLATARGQRIAVLGSMAELGSEARAMHADVGAFARNQGIERLIAVGAGCEGYADGFGASVEAVASHEEAVDRVLADGQGATTVLVKGSRSAAMDRVVAGLKKKGG